MLHFFTLLCREKIAKRENNLACAKYIFVLFIEPYFTAHVLYLHEAGPRGLDVYGVPGENVQEGITWGVYIVIKITGVLRARAAIHDDFGNMPVFENSTSVHHR